MIFTARPWGSTNFWMSHQRMPAWTRIVFCTGEKARILLSLRMSRCRLPGLAVCPPMLKCPPPTEIGTCVLRKASWTSSTVVGVAIAQTGIGFRRVTSLTMRGCVDMASPSLPDRQVVGVPGQRIFAVLILTGCARAKAEADEEHDRPEDRDQKG